MAKLVLDIEPEVIDRMERSANRRHLSMSDYVKDLFKKSDIVDKDSYLENKEPFVDKASPSEEDEEFLDKISRFPISPEIKALTGILKGVVPDDVDIKELKWEYLKNKHGL